MKLVPSGSYAKLTLGRVNGAVGTDDLAEIVPGQAYSGWNFRWTDSPDYQYIYGLGTNGRTMGTYAAKLTLYDSGNAVLAESDTYYFILK